MRRPLLLIIWLLSDLAIFVGAYVLAYFLRVGWILSTDFPFDLFIRTVMLTAPVGVLVLGFLGVYRLMRNQNDPRNILHIIFSCVIGCAFFTLAYYFLYTDFFSRLLLVYALVLSTGFLIIWHIGYEQVMRRLLRLGRPVYPTLIIGATREAAHLIKILNNQKNPLTPVAILDGRGAKEAQIENVPVEGKLNKLEETIKKHHITHMIQASDLEQSLNLLSACRNHGIHYMMLPSVLGIVERNEWIESLEGRPVNVVRSKKQMLEWFFG